MRRRSASIAVFTLLAFAPLAVHAQGECTNGCPDELKAQPPPPPVYYPPVYYPPPPYPAAPYPPAPYPPPAYAPVAPPSVHYETQPMYGLMTAGLVIFGASWSINAVSAYLADDGMLAIPVVGPIIEASDYNDHHSDVDGNRLVTTLLVFDALVQAAGFGMALGGMIARHKVKVYDQPKLTVLPSVSSAGMGLAAFGHF